MDEQNKREYHEKYQKEKAKGIFFFPDLLFKDAVVSLLIFVTLILLAYFVGAPLEEQANPADTSYTPRPEWYFIFLFQLLKYFPGSMEVIGVIVIPTIAILVLAALPLLDRGSKRHFLSRKLWVGITAMLAVGVTGLTIVAFLETPPPSDAFRGDETAALYAENCAGCHGAAISTSAGTNLHTLIAEGKHEGMPAWSADLTSDQIDALAGFILSPLGSRLFADNCGTCHQVDQLVASNPIELKQALEEGDEYSEHEGIAIPNWADTMAPEERTSLVNFLIAPDGQRLFSVNCSSCHGQSVGFTGDESDLRSLISLGGLHLAMPPWQESLSEVDIDLLAKYVVAPATVPEALPVYQELCSSCHGDRVPKGDDLDQAREIIASGGSHQTMPVWGDILTPEQMDALVTYTLSAAGGFPAAIGQDLYSQYCSACHGDFGEGGANPALSGDIIAPISTTEYLKTRDNLTLSSVISQGQPNFGMSPFGSTFGGPLDEDEIDAIVTFIRTWEDNPPVELPPEIAVANVPLSGVDIYSSLCAQCHGEVGEGGIGPSFRDEALQQTKTDPELFESISLGHSASSMIAWGEILTSDQITQVVQHIRNITSSKQPPPEGEVSFSADVLTILDAKCNMCHGALGGWAGTTYRSVMDSGDNAPVVTPGDPEGSLLGQKLLGAQTQGNVMPPSGKMDAADIQMILDWIAAGALDN
ncbi:MAG: c-type cytochrome [Anaerolineales bacterium]|nr:c-type cytochrome [Anaerolineales bacterium]